MSEVFTLLLLFGALLYRTGIGIVTILILSALTSAFFFSNFLSRKALVRSVVMVITIITGAVFMSIHDVHTPQAFFASRIVTGTVESVDRRLDKTLLVVQDNAYHQNIQVTMRSDSAALPGDTVQVKGTIDRPTDFLTDTGRLFPYQQYLASKDIAGTVPIAQVTSIETGHSVSIIRIATIARFHIAELLSRYISFPVDGIIAGMIVGYQGNIPSMLQDLFRTTGVLHVLVLSGENITLLALFLAIVLRSLPFHLRSVLTGVAIVMVVLISGAGVAAIRAGVMGIIALSAGVVRRSYVPFRALTISVLFFFFYAPESIFSDPGFHLSVLATLFMVIVLPKIEPWFQWIPKKYSLRELFMLATCVPLFMLPYTMYFSGLVPTASPFANIMMALMTSILMLSGAVILTVSWLPPLAHLIGTLVSFMGNTVIAVLHILNTLPQLNTPPLAWWGVIAVYLFFFGILFRSELRQFWYDQKLQLKSSSLPQTSSSEQESP